MRKKGDLSRAIMMRDQFREDGRTIGRLRLANKFLARRLAELGLHPEDDIEADPLERVDVDALASAWVQAAEVDAALSYERAGGRG